MAKGIRKATSGRARARRQGARRPETKAQKAAQERAAENAGIINAIRMISGAALKRAVTDINSILEHNSEQAGTIGEIKRAAQEKGMDPVALGLLARLWRKGQRNAVKMRSILDSFDYGRDVLKLDQLKAADMFLDAEGASRRKRSRGEEAEGDQLDIERDAQLLAAADAEAEGAEVHDLNERRLAEAS
jgi:hypothetical protein